MLQAAWFPHVMQGIPCEVYVVDAATLRLLHANEAACRCLHYAADEITGLRLTDVAPDLSEARLEKALQDFNAGTVPEVRLHTRHRRKDGACYAACLRLIPVSGDSGDVLIVIGNNAEPAAGTPSASLFSAHTAESGMTVLIFRFALAPDGRHAFHYLSEGCQNLLGMSAVELLEGAHRFLSLLVPEDRAAYLESMRTSAASLSVWNWEGRIRLEDWPQAKWINLRATPHALPDGQVQWEGVMSNITESKSAQLELISSRAQLAELSAHIETVKEQERTRIAREIHDDMGGNLTAIKMALALLTRRLPQGDARLHEKAAYVDTLIDRTIESVHRIAGDLRPSVLDFGLVASIAWQAREFEKQTGIACAFETNKDDIHIPSSHATALFRIVQEALANISKHAQASGVTIRLRHKEDHVQLEVADNGRGIVAQDCLKPKSFGIRGMKERANALGCDFTIEGERNKGTRIAITIPLIPS